MSETNPQVRPGERLHVLVPITIPTRAGSFSAHGANLDRGATLCLTAELIDAQRDRFGNLAPWLAFVGDDDAQIAHYGHVISRPGPAPADLERWEYGDAIWTEERDAARRNAWAILDESERADALAEVERRFGPAKPNTPTTIYRDGTPSERAAEAQEREFAAQRAAGTR